MWARGVHVVALLLFHNFNDYFQYYVILLFQLLWETFLLML